MEQTDIPTLQIDEKPTVVQGPTQVLELEKALGCNSKRYDRALQLALSIASLMLLYFIASSLYPDISNFYAKVFKPSLIRYWPNIFVALSLPVVAFNLYLFRNYRRFAFGVTEIVFGIGLGWYGVNKMVDTSVYDGFVVIVASVYLVGRGFINIRFPVPVEHRQAPEDAAQTLR
jgi:hypothetical protein